MASWFLFMGFVLLSAMTVMNMLIGVLCEVISEVAQAEREEAAISMVKRNLLTVLKDLDEDGSGEISQSELRSVSVKKNVGAVLQHLNVDINYLMEFQEMLYDSQDELSIPFIMDMILNFRGDRAVTVKDLFEAQAFTRV